MRSASIFLTTLLAASAVACSGTGGEKKLPASPSDTSGGNTANLTAPTPDSPGDDAQLDNIRPTLRVNNATSSGSGSRDYEFQIADNSTFSLVAGRIAGFVVTVSQAGVPEGTDGKTSYPVPVDLLPSTRYYWRARAHQGSSTGPWSSTSRFRTKVDSFKSGNQVFDILSNGRTVADEFSNISFLSENDANPGCKLNGPDSYLLYRIPTLSEGEISFVARRVKPGSFNDEIKIISMQDGTGDFNSNPFRVRVEKRPPGDAGKVVFQMVSQGNAPAPVETGPVGWEDHRPYYFKLEWRGGTARLRVFVGENEAAPTMVDLSTSYTAPYNPTNHVVLIGSLMRDTLRDARISRLWIGPGARPLALGSALTP